MNINYNIKWEKHTLPVKHIFILFRGRREKKNNMMAPTLACHFPIVSNMFLQFDCLHELSYKPVKFKTGTDSPWKAEEEEKWW